MRDPYDVLGVKRDDDDDAIRNAFRKLAKKHHPDLNAGKPEAAERFKEINAAHDLLTDPQRRGRFDRGEIDADGNETGPRYRPRNGAGPQPQAFDFEDLESLFGDAFGRARAPAGGQDVRYTLTVDFLEAARGGVRRLSLPDRRVLDVTIPPGTRTGDSLRLRGQGRPASGVQGGKAGDAIVEITVTDHPHFRREGDDIVLRLPVTLQELVLGAALTVPTISGSVRLTIPPHSAHGARLRLRGKGFSGGHQYVELSLVLPSGPEPELDDFLRMWKPANPVDPRAGLPSG